MSNSDSAAGTGPAVWSAVPGEMEWTAYEDPHLPSGENAAQVKILAANVFLARFPPGFSAPAHAHPHDTVYHVTKGRIRFGDEGWFAAGSVRGVSAGHEYGPEEADADVGAEFLLVSSGPIDILWAE
ncbi:cupin domain-containing protein [Amycolatopsis rubida]|uniref:Cupin domain-containing protein n=1 Tax=Amycolatopsis rubida TaxID=112413 RepID=A0A1I5X7K2_9PSEU|nr:hypothetical protein [Amycolatopsis rubida]SFQ27918.1 hypothetical protein SAMN05421854_11078 [Amycolatopsis rubida]